MCTPLQALFPSILYPLSPPFSLLLFYLQCNCPASPSTGIFFGEVNTSPVVPGLPPYSSPLSLPLSLKLQRYPSHLMSMISIHVFPSNVIQCLAYQNIECILAYWPQFCKCKMPASDLKAYTLFLQYSLFLCMPNPNPILIQPFVCPPIL
jgi:hypothetical protein